MIVGISVVLFTANLASRNSSSSLQRLRTTTPSPAASLQVEGNKVVNTDGGYSFVLPSGWKAKVSSFSKTDTIFGTNFLNDLGIGYVRVHGGDKSLSDALSKENPQNITKSEQIIVDGTPAVIQDFKSGDSNLTVDGKAIYIYKNEKTYYIELISENTEDIAKFQEIISSFKFTDETANWKTYTDPEYGFQIKYPRAGQAIDLQGQFVNGKCGMAIKESPYPLGPPYVYELWVDNFFEVLVRPWTGTINDFLQQENIDVNTVKSLNVANADGAVTMAKPGYTIASKDAQTGPGDLEIIKKNGNLFLLHPFQNDGNFGGCVKITGAEAYLTFKFTQ
jgi:hypothetical protein